MKKGFSKIIMLFIVILFAVIVVLGLYEAEVIRTYKIKDFEIDAIIQKDGSMRVKETTEYRFNGKYNGITITIPESINSNYYEKMTENSINDAILKDSFYNNKGLKDVSIYVLEDDEKRVFNKVGTAELGHDSVYTVDKQEGYITYKIFEPSKNEKKTFVIEYTLDDIAVAHDDCGEIWWNFVGGGVDCKISKLKINLSTQYGNILESYIHSNETGKIKSIYKNRVRAEVSSIGKNEFVGIRLVFPRQNVLDSTKISGVNALDIIHEQEESYNDKSNLRIVLNVIAILLTSGLLLYWIYLIIRYEKEFVYVPDNIDDLNLLSKYNPMIAACIAQNRDMHPRDIIAVLMDLVNRKILILETVKSFDMKKGKENIRYRLTKNEEFFLVKDKLLELDEFESSILDIFFENYQSIDLEYKLSTFKGNDRLASKVKALDEKVTKKLEEIGANFVRVPRKLLILNNLIFILCLAYIVFVVGLNISLGFNTMSSTADEVRATTLKIAIIFIICAAIALPFILYIIVIILKILNSIKKILIKFSFKFTSKKLTQAILINLMIFIIIFVLEIIFLKQSYIIICTMLFVMALMIILTDNLMSSHSFKIRNDFFHLKALEDKIVNGSLLDEKQIKDQVLWEKYLSFAIALGVGDVAEFVKYIPAFDYFQSCINDFDSIYNIYSSTRDDVTDKKIKNFEKSVDNMFKNNDDISFNNSSFGSSGSGFSRGFSASSSKGFSKSRSSSRSSSSFKGGGFSGGGGKGGRPRCILEKMK